MNELAPKLTAEGIGMLIGAMNGTGITFTKIVIGNGSYDNSESGDVGSPQMTIGLTAITEHETFVELKGQYDNSDVEYGFHMTELGIYARPDGGSEALYAYRFLSENVDYVPAASSGTQIVTEITVVVAVGNAENVNAILIEGSAYASKAAFNAHKTDEDPHLVYFGEETELKSMTSGEGAYSVFGKIAHAIEQLKAHLSGSNPHGISLKTIGAAAETHEHNANEITKGYLPIARGGTGVGTLTNLKTTLGIRHVATSGRSLGAASGHLKFETGLLVCWGKASVSGVAGGIGEKAVTFGVTFESAPCVLLGHETATPNNRKASYMNLTARGMTIYVYNESDNVSTYVGWLAIGKWE